MKELIGKKVIGKENAKLKGEIVNATENSVEVFMKKLTEAGIDCSGWFEKSWFERKWKLVE